MYWIMYYRIILTSKIPLYMTGRYWSYIYNGNICELVHVSRIAPFSAFQQVFRGACTKTMRLAFACYALCTIFVLIDGASANKCTWAALQHFFISLVYLTDINLCITVYLVYAFVLSQWGIRHHRLPNQRNRHTKTRAKGCKVGSTFPVKTMVTAVRTDHAMLSQSCVCVRDHT